MESELLTDFSIYSWYSIPQTYTDIISSIEWKTVATNESTISFYCSHYFLKQMVIGILTSILDLVDISG